MGYDPPHPDDSENWEFTDSSFAKDRAPLSARVLLVRRVIGFPFRFIVMVILAKLSLGSVLFLFDDSIRPWEDLRDDWKFIIGL